MSDETNDVEKRLAEIEERREERRKAIAQQKAAQRIQDLEALEALEGEHGETNIATVDVSPWVPGLPSLVACRAPKPAEVKRYRDRCKPKTRGEDVIPGDAVLAAEEIAASCRIYPEPDVYKQLLDARPGLHVQLGVAAIKLSQGKAAEEGKG